MSLDFYLSEVQETEVYWGNITHNLGRMASEAGLYDYLWNADQKAETAGDLIKPLAEGIVTLASNPERFKQLEAPNGWGTYEGLLRFASTVLAKCILHPTARIGISK